MAEALRIIRQRAPDLEVDGEMRGDAALSEELRSRVFLHSRLKGAANLLIMPNADAANISITCSKRSDQQRFGGTDHARLGRRILTRSATARRIINMTAIAAVDAGTSAPPVNCPIRNGASPSRTFARPVVPSSGEGGESPAPALGDLLGQWGPTGHGFTQNAALAPVPAADWPTVAICRECCTARRGASVAPVVRAHPPPPPVMTLPDVLNISI